MWFTFLRQSPFGFPLFIKTWHHIMSVCASLSMPKGPGPEMQKGIQMGRGAIPFWVMQGSLSTSGMGAKPGVLVPAKQLLMGVNISVISKIAPKLCCFKDNSCNSAQQICFLASRLQT